MTPWPNDWPTPDALQRLAREIVAGDDGVEFVFGHAVIQALRSPPRHSSNLLGWFRATMTRARIDWLRSPEFRGQDDLHEGDDGFLFDALAQESDPEEMDRAELTEMVEFLNSEVDALSSRDREIVHLDFWEGLSVIEISARLDISESTVLRTKRRVLESMRETVGTEPERNGRALLALAGVPARLWRHEAATAAVAGVGPLALIVAGLFAAVLLVTLQVTSRGASPASEDGVLAQPGGLPGGHVDSEPVKPDRLAVLPGNVDRTIADPSESQSDALASPDASDDGVPAPISDEVVDAPKQVFILTVTNWDRPFSGMKAEAWTLNDRARPERSTATVEEVEPGVYRFEMPLTPKTWHIGVFDRARRGQLLLERPLRDGTLRETIHLELVGRSFSVPPAPGTKFTSAASGPWSQVVGITDLRPATWLMSTPRPHGGAFINGAFEHTYDGFLHFDGAHAAGMTLRYFTVGVDRSSFPPVEKVREVEFVAVESTLELKVERGADEVVGSAGDGDGSVVEPAEAVEEGH